MSTTRLSPIEKVIDETSAKVFNFKTEVLILDDYTGKSYHGCQLSVTNPVPVFDDSGKQLGSVVLESDSFVVTGDFYIDFSTPERFNIETHSIPLYPVLQCDEECEKHKNTVSVTKLNVTGVVLSMFPPDDDRLASI